MAAAWQAIWITNATVSPIEEHPWEERLSSAIIFTSFATLGCLVNFVPIALTFTTKLASNNVNLLVGHLSIVDLFVCLIFVGGQNFYILYKDTLSEDVCRWIGFVSASCGFQVFTFPAFLSLNRYIALYHSHHYERWNTRRNVLLTILLSWAFVFAILLTFALGGKTRFDDDNDHCCIVVKNSTVWTIYFWFVCMVPIVGFGDGTVIFCNVKIYRRLKKHAENRSLSKNVIRQHKELLWFLIIEMIVPIVFHTVYLIAKFVYIDRRLLLWKQFFTILYLMNSTVRSIVTLTVLAPYRRKLTKLFVRRTSTTPQDTSVDLRDSIKLLEQREMARS